MKHRYRPPKSWSLEQWRAYLEGQRSKLIGCRVKLISLEVPDEYLKPGMMGKVESIDDAGTIHVFWDAGRGLGLIHGDKWELIA